MMKWLSELGRDCREYWPVVLILLVLFGVFGAVFYIAIDEAETREAFMEAEKAVGRVIQLTDHQQPFRIYKIRTEGGYVICTRKWGCFVPAEKEVERE